ncbi:CPBP family intramembrane metalloprotease [Streptomyces actinomycinicus]|uniref:CPBP family intramembrane metalloprotease n=1 Tax=Streptomyces actinomycinicus TaxID=1695166 RepID=A0A937EHR5_9ACTN|nr:CPBP family glutamic-type intramembrane protease [Streptomyces actinomycinicus]MBL1082500.1 CPBP family intramembrane metalloprotease [Streptomyces actinomycinicus]
MTQPPLDEQLPYHRLARLAPQYRWWRPLLGTLVVAVGYVVTLVLFMIVCAALGAALGYSQDADGWPEFGPAPDTALDLLSLALGIPVVLLVVRWTGGRPAGSVSSVTGRLRWRWLTLCVLTALPIVALAMGGMFLLPGDGEPQSQWVGWPAFGRAVAMLLVLVPFQAAAEEYVFRGWLTQTAGAFLRSPWAALLPQAVLFAAAHGWGTPWGFADLVVFGACAGWLTWRTGGLEASIALHTVNNLFAFGVSAAVVDGLASDETAADAPWQVVVLDVLSILLYTAAVTWWLRRRRLERTAPAPKPTATAWPYPYAYGHPVPPPWPGHPAAGAPVPPVWAGRPGPGAGVGPVWAGHLGQGAGGEVPGHGAVVAVFPAGQPGPATSVPPVRPERPESGSDLPATSPGEADDGAGRT